MDIAQVKELIRLIGESQIQELELQLGSDRIRLSKASAAPPSPNHPLPEHDPRHSFDGDIPVTIVPDKKPRALDGHIVKSPIVGTFYLSPAPGGPPFVKPGDTVKPGDILCIVEAMKVMNEISCKVSGTVADILAEDSVLVEYNQPLFRIKE